MVAGKVRVAMGLQKKAETPSPSTGGKSRPFGVFPSRASAQVQPRPPDVAELVRIVEELREREHRLETQLLEHKLLRESVAILPLLEREIAAKDERIQALESENQRLEMERNECDERTAAFELQIADLKRMLDEFRSRELKREEDISSSSQRFPSHDLSIKPLYLKKLKEPIYPENLESKKTTCYSVAKIVETEENAETETETETCSSSSSETTTSFPSRAPRIPKPPPKPSSPSSLSSTSSSSNGSLTTAADKALSLLPPPPPPPPPPRTTKASNAPRIGSKVAGPPPPPPPPAKGKRGSPTKVRRVPEVVELYHSLMRRDSRRESGTGGGDVPIAANPRDMIGEIENRSSHLLAIKTDVETQGDFIRYLITEVENASFTDIKDVVPFVKWLDDELSYLVDERAVLKHFDWPEQKADALREAAFGYCDLKKLESEATMFLDNPRQPCSPALKKMQALFEKLEHGVYNLSRMRESATKRYNAFHIPTDWLLENGFANKIKLASVKLAMKYMKRVSAELETVGGSLEEEELMVQGVRFAFRVHQFAGGFDVETMKAFQELRDKMTSCNVHCQNQQQPKYVCRSTAC